MSTSASERAYQHVKRKVLLGSYDGGDLIAEGQVADSLGVSRTPVREAFLRLEAEGLLRLYPKRGALVVPVSPGEVDDVVEARLLIERFAVAKVVAAGRHREIAAQMRDVLDRQRVAGERGQVERFNDLDREFHAALVGAAGNAIISRQYDGLRDRQLRMGVIALLRRPGRMAQIIGEHGRICDLLADGDTAGLDAFLDTHVGTTGRMARP
jgi:DNA-binding GntR family transcriptional regulator